MAAVTGASLLPGQAVGTVIGGRWHIANLISIGGTAAVYEARDTAVSHDARVAIKISRDAARPAGGKQFRQLVYEEGVRMASSEFAELRIAPKVIDRSLNYTSTSTTYYAMDLMSEDMFMRFVACGKLSPTQQAAVVRCVAEVIRHLQAANGLGILHRDVKPENVCFGRGAEKDRVYLIDWGFSDAEKDCMSSTTMVGTNGYVSRWLDRGDPGCHLMDDLTSAAYMLISVLRRAMPWGPANVLENAEVRSRRVGLKFLFSKDATKWMSIMFPGNLALQRALVMLLKEPRAGGGDAFVSAVLSHLDTAASTFCPPAPPVTEAIDECSYAGIVLPVALDEPESPPPPPKRSRHT